MAAEYLSTLCNSELLNEETTTTSTHSNLQQRKLLLVQFIFQQLPSLDLLFTSVLHIKDRIEKEIINFNARLDNNNNNNNNNTNIANMTMIDDSSMDIATATINTMTTPTINALTTPTINATTIATAAINATTIATAAINAIETTVNIPKKKTCISHKGKYI
jgi:hypothetical protein